MSSRDDLSAPVEFALDLTSSAGRLRSSPCSRLSERSRMVLVCRSWEARMKRTVLLFARIRTEWVIAFAPCDFTPRRSALSLMPVAQKMMFFPFARSSAKKTRSRSFSWPSAIRLCAFLFVARPHHALHVAAETFDPRRGQDRFGRRRRSRRKDRSRFPDSRRHRGRDVAVADHAQRRADAANFRDDLLVPRPVEHHDHDVLHALVQALSRR